MRIFLHMPFTILLEIPLEPGTFVKFLQKQRVQKNVR
jgi:hypothetical protein